MLSLVRKKSQIWVETAIYTLIGLTVIAIVLTAATPQIEKMKDKTTIRQTSDALTALNTKILDAKDVIGNVRIVDIKLAKGRIDIDSVNDQIVYTLENTRLELSEPGEKIREGDMVLETKTYGSKYKLFLTMNYSGNIDITADGVQKLKTLQAGAALYRIQIENKGIDGTSGLTNLDFSIIG